MNRSCSRPCRTSDPVPRTRGDQPQAAAKADAPAKAKPAPVRVRCRLANVGDRVNSVAFTPDPDGSLFDPLSEDVAKTFLRIPGYEVAD